jgi:prevent-host-death family protein
MKTVSSTEANRHFSKLLARAAKGETICITVRGKAVARLAPASGKGAVTPEERERRWQKLLKRLKRQPALNLPRIPRDELYD